MSIRKMLFSLLILILPLCILYLINLYGINVPFWDEWELVPLLKKAHTGELTFLDIVAQHNEHRILFPRLIMLTLALKTNWNIMYELYTNIFIASFTLFFLYSILRQTIDGHLLPSVTVILSWLIFSPVQGINWTWGWQIQIFLNVLGTVVSVWSVSRWPGKLKGIAIAIIFSVVSSFSFNNGLLTWLIVSLLLILQREKKNYHVALYIIAAVVTFSLYYIGYTKPGHHPPLLIPLYHPYDYLRYILAYIGAPVGIGNREVSIIIGLLSVIILFIGTIYIKRFCNEEFNKLLPWFALGLYALLSAFATGVGRLGFGVDQALSSRYTTISMLFIISTIVITILGISNFRRINRELPIKYVVIITSVSTLIVLSYVLSFSLGVKEFKQKKNEIENAKACLENEDFATDECLKSFYPDATTVRERLKMLKEMGLRKEIEWHKIRQEKEGGKMTIDIINDQLYSSLSDRVTIDLDKTKSLTLLGWAVDEKWKNSGDKVYIVLRSNGNEIIVLTIREYRRDVAKHFREKGYKKSGWSTTINTKKIKKGCYTLSLRLICGNNKEYYELNEDKPICFDAAQEGY